MKTAHACVLLVLTCSAQPPCQSDVCSPLLLAFDCAAAVAALALHWPHCRVLCAATAANGYLHNV